MAMRKREEASGWSRPNAWTRPARTSSIRPLNQLDFLKYRFNVAARRDRDFFEQRAPTEDRVRGSH
ncbi:hypothetical protein [Paraburkholderia sp. DGU8]|uniref:hypothetical protein n=1 Tax=Paraburkholderia sp. DGU8 TaxID=3161997 RepID=UPI003465D923